MTGSTVVSINERRKYQRVSDAVALHLEGEDERHANPSNVIPLDPTPTHIVKMSCGGMRFQHDRSLETDSVVAIYMYLASSNKTVRILSRVICSGEETGSELAKAYQKKFYVQVEFQDEDELTQRLIQQHVDFVIRQSGVRFSTHQAAHSS